MRVNVFETDDYGQKELAGQFDTEKAEKWEGDTEWDGSNMADVNVGANRWQNLYRTPEGRWVLQQKSAWENEQTTYRFLTDDKARKWLLTNHHEEAVEKYLGEVPEEWGPDSVRISLGEALAAKVDSLRQDGENRYEVVIRLLTWATANSE